MSKAEDRATRMDRRALHYPPPGSGPFPPETEMFAPVYQLPPGAKVEPFQPTYQMQIQEEQMMMEKPVPKDPMRHVSVKKEMSINI